jgi:hypothetical protein
MIIGCSMESSNPLSKPRVSKRNLKKQRASGAGLLPKSDTILRGAQIAGHSAYAVASSSASTLNTVAKYSHFDADTST